MSSFEPSYGLYCSVCLVPAFLSLTALPSASFWRCVLLSLETLWWCSSCSVVLTNFGAIVMCGSGVILYVSLGVYRLFLRCDARTPSLVVLAFLSDWMVITDPEESLLRFSASSGVLFSISSCLCVILGLSPAAMTSLSCALVLTLSCLLRQYWYESRTVTDRLIDIRSCRPSQARTVEPLLRMVAGGWPRGTCFLVVEDQVRYVRRRLTPADFSQTTSYPRAIFFAQRATYTVGDHTVEPDYHDTTETPSVTRAPHSSLSPVDARPSFALRRVLRTSFDWLGMRKLDGDAAVASCRPVENVEPL